MTNDDYSSRMNTILEIHNNRSKTGRKEGSLPHPRKVNPIPPIHYTWNRRLETFKLNTILEIKNHKRPHLVDWSAEECVQRRNGNTIDTLKKVKNIVKVISLGTMDNPLKIMMINKVIIAYFLSGKGLLIDM